MSGTGTYASQPMLVDIERDGKKIPVVVQLTKQGFVFVFHRETGEPIFPVEERPVPTDGVPAGSVVPDAALSDARRRR